MNFYKTENLLKGDLLLVSDTIRKCDMLVIYENPMLHDSDLINIITEYGPSLANIFSVKEIVGDNQGLNFDFKLIKNEFPEYFV